jgi:hypothetical protein
MTSSRPGHLQLAFQLQTRALPGIQWHSVALRRVDCEGRKGRSSLRCTKSHVSREGALGDVSGHGFDGSIWLLLWLLLDLYQGEIRERRERDKATGLFSVALLDLA